MRATRAEYNAVRKQRKAERLARIALSRQQAAAEKARRDQATLAEIIELIDNSSSPIHDIELRRLGHAYLRVARADAAKPDSVLVCSSARTAPIADSIRWPSHDDPRDH